VVVAYDYLTFRRAKSFYAKRERKAPVAKLFCPSCGIQNGLKTVHCSSCGQSLEAVAQAMPDRISLWTRILDRKIARHDRIFVGMGPLGQIAMIAFGILILLIALTSGSKLDFFLWAVYGSPLWLFWAQALIIRKRERGLRGTDATTGHLTGGSNSGPSLNLPASGVPALDAQPSELTNDPNERLTRVLDKSGDTGETLFGMRIGRTNPQ
jgi:transcription elongation factor Elf1